MSEENLTTNDTHPIIRIDDTVHRPTSWWTPAVHDLLKYLESVGFQYSPRVLGYDGQGREVLSFFAGESGKVGWYKIHSDKGLRNYARLLRDYHQAVAEYKPAADSEWAYAKGGLSQVNLSVMVTSVLGILPGMEILRSASLTGIWRCPPNPATMYCTLLNTQRRSAMTKQRLGGITLRKCPIENAGLRYLLKHMD